MNLNTAKRQTNDELLLKTITELRTAQRDITELKNKNVSITRRLERATQQSNEIHQLHDGKLLDKARKDSKSIHDLYHLAFLKQNVAEMVVWACKNSKEYKNLEPLIGLKIIMMMAMDDKWWLRHEEILLEEWLELIMTGDVTDKTRVKKK